MNFGIDFVFSRGTSKTRFNRAGLLVGVDFSASSVTFATGTQTFTLTANANVNRDWVVGSSVLAVSQAAPTGSMQGTVTSYNPATQALVLNITTSTGTGTATNWRIGSLEITRDVLTNGVESHAAATNLSTFSEEFNNAAWTKTGGTATANTFLAPNGSTQADTLTATAANFTTLQSYTAVAGQYYSFEIWLARRTGSGVVEITTDGVTYTPVVLTSALQKFTIAGTATASGSRSYGVRVVTSGDSVYAFGSQFIAGSPVPYIPTTTAQVSVAADQFSLSAAALARLATQGTIYAEVESGDVGPGQNRAFRLSGAVGDIRIGKQGVGNQGGFTAQLEVDNALYFGASVGNSQRDSGKEIASFQADINERTGLAETITAVSAFAYDGNNQIFYAGNNVEERFLAKDLTVWSGKGFGAIEVTGGHFNGSRFLFASGTTGIVFVSNDGLTWRRVNTSVINQACNEITSMTVGPNLRNLIVGAAGFAATSDDNGETWVSRNTGVAQSLNGVTTGAGLFVTCRTNSANQNILTSPDGITWTIRTTTGAGTLNDVAHNGTNLFVAVGNTGNLTTSPDGVTWTARTSNTTQNLSGVHFANGTWVAVGAAGTIVTSPDGVTWTARTSGVAVGLSEVSCFNNQFIAVGQGGVIITSATGITWTSRTSNTSSFLNGLAFSSTRLVVAGAAGAVLSSQDAAVYTARSNNGAGINGMAFGAGVFVSAGNPINGSAYIATVDLAGNYTRRVSGLNAAISNVRFLNGQFFAPTVANGSACQILTSADGVTWVNRTFSGGRIYQDIAFSGSLYVAVAGSGSFATSTDGAAFVQTTANSATTQNLRGIEYAQGLFVAVGLGGTIITSPNGTAWTAQVSGTTQQLNSVMYSYRDNLWYAAGANGTLLFSPNAITWLPVQGAGIGATDNGASLASNTVGQFKPGLNRIAISYKNGEVITSLNGSSKTDTVTSPPSITAGAMGENLNGYIRKVKLLREPVTEFEINAMTGV